LLELFAHGNHNRITPTSGNRHRAMTQTEHLKRIRAKCVELLEIASKRTQGKWDAGHHPSDWNFPHVDYIVTPETDPSAFGEGIELKYGGRVSCTKQDPRNEKSRNDARFIAACAGNFERALHSTIAAISWLETAQISVHTPEREEAERVTRDILAAWPEETLP